MRELVVGRGCQVRDHAAVVARDDDAATAGRVGGRDVVFGADAGGGAGGAEGVGVGVGADGAEVERAGWGEHVLVVGGGVSLVGWEWGEEGQAGGGEKEYLGAAGGVLGGAAGDEFGVAVLE